MEYLPQLALAWSIQLTGVISPGPSVALILGIAAAQGRRAALVTSLGIGTASIVLSLATVLGIAAIVAQVAELMTVIRFIGAGYLLWLAWGAFSKAMAPPPIAVAQVAPQPALRMARRGFLLQLTNPKAILFWLAIAAIGGVGDAPPAVVALFVLGAFVNSTLGHGAWALILSSAPVRRAYTAARRPIEAALGVLFTGFALKLAMQRS